MLLLVYKRYIIRNVTLELDVCINSKAKLNYLAFLKDVYAIQRCNSINHRRTHYKHTCICKPFKGAMSSTMDIFSNTQNWNTTKYIRNRCNQIPQGHNEQRRQTQTTKRIHKRSTTFERSVNIILLEGLNQLLGANITLISDVDQHTDVWFASKIPNSSMYHLLVNTNRNIKRR